jgi:hypothetical protein
VLQREVTEVDSGERGAGDDERELLLGLSPGRCFGCVLSPGEWWMGDEPVDEVAVNEAARIRAVGLARDCPVWLWCEPHEGDCSRVRRPAGFQHGNHDGAGEGERLSKLGNRHPYLTETAVGFGERNLSIQLPLPRPRLIGPVDIPSPLGL